MECTGVKEKHHSVIEDGMSNWGTLQSVGKLVSEVGFLSKECFGMSIRLVGEFCYCSLAINNTLVMKWLRIVMNYGCFFFPVNLTTYKIHYQKIRPEFK